MFLRKISYTPWWEEDVVQSFEDEGEEVCLIIEQGIFMAEALSCEDTTFPWHGKSESDFEKLHIAMKKSLPEAMACKTARDVVRFIKKYPEVYKAYFKMPIQFSDDFNCVNDGRHRIYTAQRLGSVIPAWKVKYKPKRNITLEEYKKSFAFGEWRFLI